MSTDRAIAVRRAFAVVLVEPDTISDPRVGELLRTRICDFVAQAREWEWNAAQALAALKAMAEDCRLDGDAIIGASPGAPVANGIADITRACIELHYPGRGDAS